jgi:hypothetical protein
MHCHNPGHGMYKGKLYMLKSKSDILDTILMLQDHLTLEHDSTGDEDSRILLQSSMMPKQLATPMLVVVLAINVPKTISKCSAALHHSEVRGIYKS